MRWVANVDINLIAWILLVGRIVSSSFVIAVVRMQLPYLRENADPKLQPMRKLLLVLMLTFLLGNTFPIALDIATLFGFRAGWTVIVYAFFNDFTILVASVMFWVMYKIAAKS